MPDVPVSALADYPVTPPPLPGPVTFDQRWGELTFVHWPVLPESVAHLYPPGTRPDVFAGGMTYVALVPFVMSSTKLVAALPLPYFGSFLETNVRLYSIDDAGPARRPVPVAGNGPSGRRAGDPHGPGRPLHLGEDAPDAIRSSRSPITVCGAGLAAVCAAG